MNVETQKQADELNASGIYGPYRAANGHLLEANLRRPRDEGPCSNCGGTGTTDNGEYICGWCKGQGTGAPREYRVGDRIDYSQATAWCANNCPACAEGDPLPDW